MQQSFGIPCQNVGTCISVASPMNSNHSVVSTAVSAVSKKKHMIVHDMVYMRRACSGSERKQFDSQGLDKHEMGFPKPGKALIGSDQLWCFNDSPYYRGYAL